MVASFSQRPTGTEIAKRAWNSTISGTRAMPQLFLSAGLGAIFVAAIVAGLAYLAGPPAARFLISLGNILAWSLLGAPVAVAMHRFILLDETTPGLLSYAAPHTRAFFLWLLTLQIAAAVLNALGSVNGLIEFAVTVAFVIVSVNLAMIFPAVAIDVPEQGWQARMRQSWEQMQGHFWLFIRASIVTFLPALGIWLLVLGAAALMGVIAHFFSPFVWFVGLWVAVAVGLLMIFVIALGAAVASWMYLWVRDPQAQSAQTATSTVT